MTDQKVALVTGASRGIGAAIAKRLSQDGYRVIVNYAGRADAAAEVIEEINGLGHQAVSFQADISDPQAVKDMFNDIYTTYGGIDVLVNNAGIMKLNPLAEVSDQEFDALIQVNLKGSFNTLREAANLLRDGGSIVNFSSSVVGLKLENYSIYAATKAAIETLTTILAKELQGRNINVNAIAPGPTATDMFLDGKSDALIEKMTQMIPLKRLGTPEDIANIVSVLVGTDGAWINGQIIRANGGIV